MPCTRVANLIQHTRVLYINSTRRGHYPTTATHSLTPWCLRTLINHESALASASFSPQTSLSNPWAHVLSAPPLTHHLHILTPPTHTHSLSPTPIQCIRPRIADRSRDLAERHFSEPEPADAAASKAAPEPPARPTLTAASGPAAALPYLNSGGVGGREAGAAEGKDRKTLRNASAPHAEVIRGQILEALNH